MGDTNSCTNQGGQVVRQSVLQEITGCISCNCGSTSSKIELSCLQKRDFCCRQDFGPCESGRRQQKAPYHEKLASIHPSSLHIIRMLDDFKLEGPSGIHQCLVFKLLGPSILGTIDQLFFGAMLPGKHAKNIAKQALLGLDILHQHKIGHGGRPCLCLFF